MKKFYYLKSYEKEFKLLTKLVACMIQKKKKSNEKSDICLSIEVFIDFGANRAHSVNMGNESGGSFTNFAN